MEKIIPKLIIEASAGSGKTYQLAKRYINLLCLSLKEKKILKNNWFCGKHSYHTPNEILPPEDLYSLIAITFTNKAAIEMKERIILFLKKLSGIYKDEKFPLKEFLPNKKESFKLLINIIKNQSDFYVTTIDSFMNKILKAFAIELGINPDYDISFKEEDIFNLAFDDILLDEKNREDLLKLLLFILKTDSSAQGFNGETIIKNSIKKFKDIEAPMNMNTITLKEFLMQKKFNSIEHIEEEGNKLINEIKEFVEINQNVLNKRMVNTFKNFTDLNSSVPKLENIKKIIIEGFNSNFFTKRATKFHKETFLYKINKLYKLLEIYIIAIRLFEIEGVLNILKNFKEKEKEIKSQLNIITGSDIAREVNHILKKEEGINYAFCRLGERISHYLIDEFQDTSRIQYEAILPLIKNAISEGGTLFVVGDKKQAIYGWRGGDFRLFDDIKDEINEIEAKFIKTNRRSCKNIVKFNNFIFNENSLSKIISNIPFFENFNEIINIYKNSSQECNIKEDGYVKVILKNFTHINDSFDDFYRENLKQILTEIIYEKNISLENIMILLRKKDNIKKIVNWIREDLPEINFITEDSLDILSNFEIKKFLLFISAVIYPFDNSYKLALEEIGFKITDFSIFEKKLKDLSPYEFFCYVLEQNFFNYEENKLYFNTLLEKVLELTQNQKTIEEICEYLYDSKNEITIKLPENLNAIKIMTIHKAKGLESHTVIIPFYDWTIYDTSFINLVDKIEIEKGKEIFVRIKKDIREIIKEADNKYKEHVKMKFIEALNLMYVANTRAIKNLFIIGAYKLKKQNNDIPKKIKASNILKVILNNDYFEDGFISKEKTQKKHKKIQKVKNAKISSSIKEHLKISTEKNELSLDLNEKYIGDLFHLAISFVDKLQNEEDIEKIAEKVYNKAINCINFKNEKVKEYIKNTLSDLKEFYINIENSWNEKEIVDVSGNIYRLDRIVKKDKYIIIDFKTGKESPLHKAQIKNYLKLFNNAEGIIYYTNKRKIINVT